MSATLPYSVLRARFQLMLRHPYLAAAVARFPIYEASELPWCDTAATDGYNILVNSDFFAELSEEEALAVMAHEVLHCVLGHIDRGGKRIHDMWNIAIDYATNLFLADSGFQLPDGVLYDTCYQGMTSEDIYGQLMKQKSFKLSSWKGRPRKRLRKSGGRDLHLDPDGHLGRQYRGSDFPTEYERSRLRSHLGKEMCSKLPAAKAAMIAEEIRQMGKAQVPWQEVLARFVKGVSLNDYSLFPFNKKHLWRGFCLPSMRTPGPEHIVVAIDTSGSMEASTLASVLAEIDTLRGLMTCALTLIQCDAAIHSVNRYEAWDVSSADFQCLEIHGRGGTSLIPPFRWLETEYKKNPILPDALIYFTDGFGAFPDQEPDIPCLWIVPKDGLEKFPFGEVLRIHEARK